MALTSASLFHAIRWTEYLANSCYNQATQSGNITQNESVDVSVYNNILATCGTLAPNASVVIDCSSFTDLFNKPSTMSVAKILYIQCTDGLIDVNTDTFWAILSGNIVLPAVSDIVLNDAPTTIPAGGSITLTAGPSGGTYNFVAIGAV